MGTPEYNRNYAKDNYGEFRSRKDRLSLALFGGHCFLCGNSENYGHYHFHHYEYHPDDSSYRRNSKAQWTRMMRLEEAEAHPERFRLLCPSCHRMITSAGTYLLRRLQPLSNTDRAYVRAALPDLINDPELYVKSKDAFTRTLAKYFAARLSVHPEVDQATFLELVLHEVDNRMPEVDQYYF